MSFMDISFKDLQRLKCEFIGTFFLCFVYSCKAHMEASLAPLAVGATYCGLVYAGGPVSGAHYNPATTVALLVRGNVISAKNATLYMLTQALGAICAAVIAGGVFAFANNAYPTPSDDVDDWNAFATEMLFTFMLAFVILHVSTRDEVKGNGYFGLAIGLAYVSALIAAGPISGCALNPAIGLLAFLNGDWNGAKQAYIYIFGPPIGAGVAGIVFRLTTLADGAEEQGQGATVFTRGVYATFVVEAVGTFFVCLVYAFSTPGIHISPLAVGCAYAAMTYAGGPVSGGCFNPVVALAVAFRNFGTDLAPIFKPSTLLLYIAAQLAGALAAGGTAAAILVGDHKIGHPSVGTGSDVGSAFLGEMVGTCLVVLVVLGTATVESTRDNMYFALAIGFAILGAGAAVGGASGGCFNPAVGLLVFCSDENLGDAWIYWVAPPIGALFGLAAFRFVYYDDVAAEELGGVSKPDASVGEGYSALA
jgi:aquaporin Z